MLGSSEAAGYRLEAGSLPVPAARCHCLAATMSLPGLTGDLVRASALLLLVWATAAAARWLRAYRSFRRMELALAGPPSLPILGNALSFLGIDHRNILSVLLGLWGGRHDTISRATIFNRMLVFVTHPDDIGRVIADPRRRFNDKPWFFYSGLQDLLGTGSASASGESWRAHRAITQPSFNVKILDGYVQFFSEETQEFVRQTAWAVERAEAAGEDGVYPFDALHNAIARGVMRATMSVSMQDGDREKMEYLVGGFGEALMSVARRTYNVLLWPGAVFLWTATARFQREYNREADAYAYAVIGRKEAAFREAVAAAGGRLPQRRRAGAVCKSFLDHVIEAKLRGQIGLSEREIVDEVKTVFSAAIETSTTTTCFAIKILSLMPEIQDRVHRELEDVFGDSERAVTPKDLTKLVYMERVVKETLRLFPTLPIVARAVHEDSDINGHMIPAGAVLILNLIGAHRHPDFHKEPLRFDPDRFERGRSAGRHPFCYLPFSAGPRNCVGQRAAMLQVKTALANTLRAFRVLPVDDGVAEPSQFPLTSDLALRYVGGVKVKFVPRPRPWPPRGPFHGPPSLSPVAV